MSPTTAAPAQILVVDDLEVNRDLLARRLVRMGHEVAFAENGQAALQALQDKSFDMVLLDITMPVMDGYDALTHIKSDHKTRHIPVVMVSAIDEIESVVRCIEAGADDYLSKPFNPILLKARVTQSLEKKRFHDAEQAILRNLQLERDKVERLLLNVLPRAIARQLQQQDVGEQSIADQFESATVLFADLIGFTELSSQMTASDLVALLNIIFSAFDALTAKHGVEKIKTIGDCYMAAAGIPVPNALHTNVSVALGLDMLSALRAINEQLGLTLSVRIGIHTGPVVAGVIGRTKFIYDLWGDTVNVASRMESHGSANRVHVSKAVADAVAMQYALEDRGVIDIKGKAPMQTYFVKAT